MLERKLLVVTGKGAWARRPWPPPSACSPPSGDCARSWSRWETRPGCPSCSVSPGATPGVETKLEERLWSISIDPDRALLEWLQALGGRVSGRVLASSSTFQYFAAAAPAPRSW